MTKHKELVKEMIKSSLKVCEIKFFLEIVSIDVTKHQMVTSEKR